MSFLVCNLLQLLSTTTGSLLSSSQYDKHHEENIDLRKLLDQYSAAVRIIASWNSAADTHSTEAMNSISPYKASLANQQFKACSLVHTHTCGHMADTASGTRMQRLAQELGALASSLPLNESSSVFVRYDDNRIDLMKVVSATCPSTGMLLMCLRCLDCSCLAMVSNVMACVPQLLQMHNKKCRCLHRALVRKK